MEGRNVKVYHFDIWRTNQKSKYIKKQDVIGEEQFLQQIKKKLSDDELVYEISKSIQLFCLNSDKKWIHWTDISTWNK